MSRGWIDKRIKTMREEKKNGNQPDGIFSHIDLER